MDEELPGQDAPPRRGTPLLAVLALVAAGVAVLSVVRGGRTDAPRPAPTPTSSAPTPPLVVAAPRPVGTAARAAAEATAAVYEKARANLGERV